jgi:hypothetical protein
MILSNLQKKIYKPVGLNGVFHGIIKDEFRD